MHIDVHVFLHDSGQSASGGSDPTLAQLAAQVASIATAVAQLVTQGNQTMSTVQDLTDKFTTYIADRDAVDAAKDAASAAKDATIADQVQKLADAAAKAGVDAQTIADLQAGIDAAVAKEQAAIDALNPPAPPVAPAPADGSTPANDPNAAPVDPNAPPAA